MAHKYWNIIDTYRLSIRPSHTIQVLNQSIRKTNTKWSQWNMKWPETWLCSSSLNDLLTKASHAPCTTCLVSLVPEDSPEKCDKLREEVSQVCTFTNFLYVFVCFALLLLLCVISSSSYISLLSSRETLSLFYCLLVRYRFVVCCVEKLLDH